MNLLKRLAPGDAPKPDKYTRRIARMAITSIVLLGFAVFGYVINNHANQANNGVHGSCQFYYDLASVPTTAKSSVSLFTIIADSRHAYMAASCDLGPLPPVDPRVKPYIKGHS